MAESIFSGFSSARTVPQIGGDSTARRTTLFVQNPTTPGGALTPLNVITYQRNELPQNYWDQLSQNLGQQVQFALSISILNGLQVRTNVQRTIIAGQQAQLQAEQARLTLRQSIEQADADARAAQLQYAASKRQVVALTTTQRNAESASTTACSAAPSSISPRIISTLLYPTSCKPSTPFSSVARCWIFTLASH